jgi:hypothetical protein
MKFFVYLLNAAGSEAMKVLSWPSPIVMGDPLQATTISSGCTTLTRAMPQAPSQRDSA